MAKKGVGPGKHFKNERYLKALGEHCRKLRIRGGISVNRLARQSERLSLSVIIRIESGSGSATISSLIRYASGLNWKRYGLH